MSDDEKTTIDKATGKNGFDEAQYTVAELIKALSKVPGHLLVWHEGCDCWGNADGVELRHEKNGKPDFVLITRSHE